MGILHYIFGTLFGCGLLSLACLPHPNANAISIASYTSTTTPNAVTVVTTVNGSTTEKVIPAPYGVKTSVVETYNGTTPVTEASTTPLTQADIQQMQQQEANFEKQMLAMQKQMDQMFVDQQKMFDAMWSNF